jgi:zinc and cadmium transporter
MSASPCQARRRACNLVPMSPLALLSIYCPLIFLSALSGGLLPFLFRLTHVWLQVVMSFVGGAMLGVGLLSLLPHAFYECDRAIYPPVVWLLAGFLLMFFVERVFHFHHHDTPTDAGAGSHTHDHDHSGHTHDHHHDEPRRLTWGAALIGLSLHSMIDGMTLTASVVATSSHGIAERLAGFAVFLVIVLHKPFDSLTLGTLMLVGRQSAKARHLVNLLYALAVPAGATLAYLGVRYEAAGGHYVLGPLLALAAGTFVCIATSDLLPELQFHSHDRFKLSAALLAGILLAGGMVWIEESGHSHDHEPSHSEPHIEARAEGAS